MGLWLALLCIREDIGVPVTGLLLRNGQCFSLDAGDLVMIIP